MLERMINRAMLDPVVAGEVVDTYYHLGLSSDDPTIETLREVGAVVLTGSGERAVELATRWQERRRGAQVLALPKEDRFVTRYCDRVLFVSHGMGVPSASIAIQELMRLSFVLKAGQLDRLDEVLWARVGTCGGVGLAPGTVLVSTEAVMADLGSLHLNAGPVGDLRFDGRFPADLAGALLATARSAGHAAALGRTLTASDFFVEQVRLDGPLRLATPGTKRRWLRDLRMAGVLGIEMEGAILAGLLNQWGFPRFAMVCAVIVDRLRGDQIVQSPDELRALVGRAGDVVLDHLDRTMS